MKGLVQYIKEGKLKFDTEDKKKKVLKKKGQNITFKEEQGEYDESMADKPFPLVGKSPKSGTQIFINKKIDKKGHFQIFNKFGQASKKYDSIEDAIEAVDWDFMEGLWD